MSNIADIPPEILARAFEIGVHSWGITFMHPVSLVCKVWRDIVADTPHLWGIISLEKSTPARILEAQISKAKATPLCVTIPTRRLGRNYLKVTSLLLSLSSNWVWADLGAQHLVCCDVSDLRRHLGFLRLHGARSEVEGPNTILDNPDFKTPPSRLHSFHAVGLPKSWITPFLGPAIREFRLQQNRPIQKNTDDLETYLSLIPQAVIIEFDRVFFSEPFMRLSSKIITMKHLQILRLTNMTHAPAILCALSAPSLQLLTVSSPERPPRDYPWQTQRDFVRLPMSPAFAHWSQDNILLVHLRTLELINCLKPGDGPFLIRWLQCLPNLVSLFIKDSPDSYRPPSLSQDSSHALFEALASPQRSDTDELSWLCP